ncbi:MAG: flagellar filament capping protein FliD, partial [Verrucomicrobia bacterium]|nr:flagellar filament capping protein FliD [Verrucomicrobiota bacterium]
MSSSSVALSGLASGFDWQSLVTQLVTLERSPETQLQSQQDALGQQNIALGGIKTELGVLQNAAVVLKDPTFFDSRTATPSDSTLASATADAGTTIGTYSFSVTQLASAAVWKGNTTAGGPLSSHDISSQSADTSGLTLSTAPFAQPVTAGTFTVNGKQITIGATDTLKSVFDQISSVTNGAVTAGYSSTSDKITLSSGSAITLGSGADTSNFLQAAKLSNSGLVTNLDGSATVASAVKLGAVQMKVALDKANLGAPISDGGSGNGGFTINGVSISFSASSDSLTNVIDRINSSDAGVTASYDSTNNRLSLTNKNTGDVGISLQDNAGSTFLAATGLTSGAGGTLTSGKDLLYTVNGGPQLSSRTNTITADSSGISGLSVTALAEKSFTVKVAGDTAKIKTAITNFVGAYNKAQATINTETASSTDASGVVTAGTLAGDQDTASTGAATSVANDAPAGSACSTLPSTTRTKPASPTIPRRTATRAG